MGSVVGMYLFFICLEMGYCANAHFTPSLFFTPSFKIKKSTFFQKKYDFDLDFQWKEKIRKTRFCEIANAYIWVVHRVKHGRKN